MELASFTLYDYLKRQNIGRSHKEIIPVTKITGKILKDFKKENPMPIINNTPKSILENFDMKSVGLNEADRSQLIELCNYFSGIRANPYSVACSLTYV